MNGFLLNFATYKLRWLSEKLLTYYHNLPGYNFKAELDNIEDEEAGEEDVEGGAERGADKDSH